MSMRGVRKPGARTTTSAVRGEMRDAATRAEAISLMHRPLTGDRGLAGAPRPGPLVWGVVNVTPDSFSDGGRRFEPDGRRRARPRAGRRRAPTWSTSAGSPPGPGAARVPVAEELAGCCRWSAELAAAGVRRQHRHHARRGRRRSAGGGRRDRQRRQRRARRPGDGAAGRRGGRDLRGGALARAQPRDAAAGGLRRRRRRRPQRARRAASRPWAAGASTASSWSSTPAWGSPSAPSTTGRCWPRCRAVGAWAAGCSSAPPASASWGRCWPSRRPAGRPPSGDAAAAVTSALAAAAGAWGVRVHAVAVPAPTRSRAAWRRASRGAGVEGRGAGPPARGGDGRRLDCGACAARGRHGVLAAERELGQVFSADVDLHRRHAARRRSPTTWPTPSTTPSVAADVVGRARRVSRCGCSRCSRPGWRRRAWRTPGCAAVAVAVHKPQAPVRCPSTTSCVRVVRRRGRACSTRSRPARSTAVARAGRQPRRPRADPRRRACATSPQRRAGGGGASGGRRDGGAGGARPGRSRTTSTRWCGSAAPLSPRDLLRTCRAVEAAHGRDGAPAPPRRAGARARSTSTSSPTRASDLVAAVTTARGAGAARCPTRAPACGPSCCAVGAAGAARPAAGRRAGR